MRVTNRATLLLSAGIVLALAGCKPSANDRQDAALTGNAFFPAQPNGALPLSNQNAPLRYGPPAAALPRAHPVAYYDWDDSPDSYGYIDQADDLFDLIGDAPPDYGVTYDDADYWAWQFDDGYSTYVEPIDDGYRYYYYEPGAVTPFFVSDPRYSYAYHGGRVAAVYAGGRLVQPSFAQQQAAQAAAYYARGRSLRAAAASPTNRTSVPAPVWAARRAAVLAPRTAWNAARQSQPEWQTYRTRQQASGRNADFVAERAARVDAGRRFDAWQRQGFQGAAPQLYARSARGAAAVAGSNVPTRPELRGEAGRAAALPANPVSVINREAERGRALAASQQAQLREAGQQQARAVREQQRVQATQVREQAQLQARAAHDQQRAQATQVREQAQLQARAAHDQQRTQVTQLRQQRIEQRQQTVELHRQAPQPHIAPPQQMGARPIQVQQQPHFAAPPRPQPVAPAPQGHGQPAQPDHKDHDKH